MKRNVCLRTCVRGVIGLVGVFLLVGWFFGWLRRSAVYRSFLASALLIFLWWGVR